MSLFGIGLWLAVAYLGVSYAVGGVLGVWMWVSGQGMRGEGIKRRLLGGVSEGQRSKRFGPRRRVTRRVVREEADGVVDEPVGMPAARRLRRAA
ncbi:MAG: hypothetical protein AAF750_11565 [Planctomycetota bacterium]